MLKRATSCPTNFSSGCLGRGGEVGDAKPDIVGQVNIILIIEQIGELISDPASYFTLELNPLSMFLEDLKKRTSHLSFLCFKAAPCFYRFTFHCLHFQLFKHGSQFSNADLQEAMLLN